MDLSVPNVNPFVREVPEDAQHATGWRGPFLREVVEKLATERVQVGRRLGG